MFDIHGILCGYVETTHAQHTYLTDPDVDVASPTNVFLLKSTDADDDTTIVVDTGIRSASEAPGLGIEGGGPEPIREGLANHDVTPEDVDYVLLTHLHIDHADNVELFGNAEIFVQAAEMDAASDPLPPNAFAYADDTLGKLERLDTTIINGGYRFGNGIELLLTPGHTRGQQSVVVPTSAGPYAIISDLAYSRHNIDPTLETIVDGKGRTIDVTSLEHGGNYHPPGILENMQECYESIARIREHVDDEHLLAAHFAAVAGSTYPRDGSAMQSSK